MEADTPTERPTTSRDSGHELDIWKHFSASASTDKHTMITTVTWLLGFSIGAVAYAITKLIRSERPPFVEYPGQTVMISVAGMAISALAAYVTLLYAGYASRNWAKADAIAIENKWTDLLPNPGEPVGSNVSSLTKIAWRLGRGVDHQREIPPVFRVFFFGAIAVLTVNLVLFLWAAAALVILPPRSA